ncbi:hypothetical protein HY406_01055 [Candidatus Giovannonibacteria bacterium]|nr:hypothetical protein [Candidatus Giovannonibacteria bacterium]
MWNPELLNQPCLALAQILFQWLVALPIVWFAFLYFAVWTPGTMKAVMAGYDPSKHGIFKRIWMEAFCFPALVLISHTVFFLGIVAGLMAFIGSPRDKY